LQLLFLFATMNPLFAIETFVFATNSSLLFASFRLDSRLVHTFWTLISKKYEKFSKNYLQKKMVWLYLPK